MVLKPDIRIVIASLAGGGSERVAVLLANEWTRCGITVDIITCRPGGVYASSLPSSVRTYSPNRRTLLALPAIARYLDRFPRVPALLFGYDIGVGLGAIKTLGLLNTPLIYREGSSPIKNVARRGHWAYAAFISRTSGIIAQTTSAARELEQLGLRRRPLRIIANPLARSEEARFDPCDQTDLSHVVAIGRLSREKGFDRLIRAWPSIMRAMDNARLTIVGEGADRRDLERLVNDLGLQRRVTFAGFTPDPREFLTASTLFVMPSYHEGMPNALLEAVAAGCAIMCSGGEAVREILCRLGLAECYVEDAEWVNGIENRLRAALQVPSDRRREATVRILRLTDIGRVARDYFSFCNDVAGSRAEGITW